MNPTWYIIGMNHGKMIKSDPCKKSWDELKECYEKTCKLEKCEKMFKIYKLCKEDSKKKY